MYEQDRRAGPSIRERLHRAAGRRRPTSRRPRRRRSPRRRPTRSRAGASQEVQRQRVERRRRRARQFAGRGRGSSGGPYAFDAGRDRRPRRDAQRDHRGDARRSRGLHTSHPKLKALVIAGAHGDRAPARADRLGRSPRPWRSARCCSRAPASGSRGQDSRRGTFSQRHAVLVDTDTGAEYTPLAARPRQAGRVQRLRQPAVRGGRAGLRLRLHRSTSPTC